MFTIQVYGLRITKMYKVYEYAATLTQKLDLYTAAIGPARAAGYIVCILNDIV